MTVSRTINGHPYVSAKTAKKVRAAIRRLAYRPNHAARILNGQMSRAIGIVVPDIADRFFSVIIQAVQETARARGYLVWVTASNEDPAIEAAQVEMMTHHPVDGIVLVPVDSRNGYFKSLAAGTTPIITVDRPMELAATDSIGVENRKGAHLAVDHLIQHGYKKIFCVTVNAHLLTIKERIAGYKESMRRAKLPCPEVLRLRDYSTARSALSELFNSGNRPDALFTTNNAATIWVIEALQDLKVELAKDVALAGFDDVEFFALITPPITAVRQPASELGAMAAQMLLRRINRESRAPFFRTILPVTLTIRESCGCKKKQ